MVADIRWAREERPSAFSLEVWVLFNTSSVILLMCPELSRIVFRIFLTGITTLLVISFISANTNEIQAITAATATTREIIYTIERRVLALAV